MERDDYLVYSSMILFLFSVALLFSTFNTIEEYRVLVTGFATEGAFINLTIASFASLNFTNDSVSFGSGAVTSGQVSATIDTLGTVTGGNWSATNIRFLINNIGNENLTLNISSGKTAGDFIGGNSPEYKYNVSDFGMNVCDPPTDFNLETFYELNATPDSRLVCNTFEPGENITIDLRLIIPNNSNIGTLSDSISVIYSESSP